MKRTKSWNRKSIVAKDSKGKSRRIFDLKEIDGELYIEGKDKNGLWDYPMKKLLDDVKNRDKAS